jgi:splicing factor 3B subunit 2
LSFFFFIFIFIVHFHFHFTMPQLMNGSGGIKTNGHGIGGQDGHGAAAQGRKLTKNEKKRLKKKENVHDQNDPANTADHSNKKIANGKGKESDDEDGKIEIDYISADLNDIVGGDESIMQQFKNIFEKFTKAEDLTAKTTTTPTATADPHANNALTDAGEAVAAGEADTSDEPKKISKKKKKLMSRLTVAQLKQLVQRPDVVEAHDITASDPRLLVYLKAYRNTIPVPRHWCHIRQYLQGKRGIEKPPFQLPEFIADTGIAKIRETVMEQESQKKAKQKARDKMQPKTGKIDIDYQVLHDAFFKYQTKPKLTTMGELYYEGKEFEVHMKEMKPGVLSAALKEALGMGDNMPPPWLINMQRYGPPPSYPTLKIPGLSAPIPPGCQFGYHVGGWGKPPVDEYGRPLYGDVFGAVAVTESVSEAVDKTSRWGTIKVQEDEGEEDDEEEEAEEEEGPEATERQGRKGSRGEDASGVETPSTIADGISTINSGLETPDIIDLRKRLGGTETPDSVYGGGAPKELYTVIQERASVGGSKGQLFGSDRTYVVPSASGSSGTGSLNDIDEDEAGGADGDYADGDADDGKGKRKRRLDSSSVAKRYKDFKF